MGLRPDVSCQDDRVIPDELIVREILVETAFHSDPYNCYIHFHTARFKRPAVMSYSGRMLSRTIFLGALVCFCRNAIATTRSLYDAVLAEMQLLRAIGACNVNARRIMLRMPTCTMGCCLAVALALQPLALTRGQELRRLPPVERPRSSMPMSTG